MPVTERGARPPRSGGRRSPGQSTDAANLTPFLGGDPPPITPAGPFGGGSGPAGGPNLPPAGGGAGLPTPTRDPNALLPPLFRPSTSSTVGPTSVFNDSQGIPQSEHMAEPGPATRAFFGLINPRGSKDDEDEDN